MKVRLFTLAAVAATTLLSQGVAQSDSLERALADLNSGLVAPAGNAGVTWGGDFRLRNEWTDTDTDINDNRDFDSRMRLTASFNITEDSSAFAGFAGTEHWGGSGDNADWGLDRAYFTVNNLMGDGGSMKAGRDYYTYGSGRIIGSSDWADEPSSHSGIWYSHDMGGMNMNFAMLNQDAEAGVYAGGENGQTGGDDMLYVLSMDYALDLGASLGVINMTPYVMRDEGVDNNNWKGASLAGSLMGFGYDAEYAKYEGGNGDEGTAWAVSTSIDLAVLSSLPGISNGGVDISMSSSDDDFDTNGPVTHGVGGFGDHSGDGAWAGGTDITTIGLNFSPAEGWGGRIAFNDVDGATNYKETDVSVSHDFGGNVSGWFGYAMINEEDADDAVTFWTTMSVSF